MATVLVLCVGISKETFNDNFRLNPLWWWAALCIDVSCVVWHLI